MIIFITGLFIAYFIGFLTCATLTTSKVSDLESEIMNLQGGKKHDGGKKGTKCFFK